MNIPNLKNNKWLAVTAGVTLTAAGALAPSAEAAQFKLNFDEGVNGSAVQKNADGTLVTTQWVDWGLTNISGVNDRTGKAAKLNLYNTKATYNIDGRDKDDDLRTGSTWGTASASTNALIIQEEDWRNKRYFNDNNQWRADDEAKGGTIDFDFAKAVSFNSFSLIDIDDNGGGIGVGGYDGAGNKILDIDIDALMAKHIQVNGQNEAAAQGTSVSIGNVTMTQVGNERGNNSYFKFDVTDAYLNEVRFSYPGSGAISSVEWGMKDETQEIPEPSAIGGLLVLGLIGGRKRLNRKAVSA